MKTTLMLILVGLCAFAVAEAQNESKPVKYPKQVSIEHNEAVKSFSSDFVSASGSPGSALGQQNLFSGGNNVAYINQLGDYNSAVLTQYGTALWGIIDIEGNYNEATLSQSGNHLLSMLKLEGDYNSMEFDQSGSYNGAFFYLEGTGLHFSAMQNDQGIQLMQSGSTIPLSIQHSGHTVPIIISNQ